MMRRVWLAWTVGVCLVMMVGCAQPLAIEAARESFRRYREATVPHPDYNDEEKDEVDCGGPIDKGCLLPTAPGTKCLGHRADELIRRLGEE